MDAQRLLLTPIALAYRGVIALRNRYYDHHAGAVYRVGVPVISVGNLTVGGTGKTPTVIEIVRHMVALGGRPAILTRGYRARSDEIADEVLEFNESLPNVPVVVDADRVSGAARARGEHGADCLVLDDGFQHRRLARDLDLVLIDALRPFGGEALLPAGRLREPLSSLRRADVLILTRSNQVSDARRAELVRRLNRLAPGRPLVEAQVVADFVRQNDATLAAEELSGVQSLAVCGLGNPETFARLLGTLGASVAGMLSLADHQHYDERLAERIVAAALDAGVKTVVTTRKDWVKLSQVWPDGGVALLRLDVRTEFTRGSDVLEGCLRSLLEDAR